LTNLSAQSFFGGNIMGRDYKAKIFIEKNELIDLLNKLKDGTPEDANDFFSKFEIWELYSRGMFHEALNYGYKVLELCEKFNPDVYSEIHKGYMFYFMGLSAFKIRDFQTAIFYMDATLSEDIRNFPENKRTPPGLFFILDGDDEHQRGQDLVREAQQIVQKYIDKYNKIIKNADRGFSELNIDLLRNNFLKPKSSSNKPADRSIVTSLISYFLEFDSRYSQLSIRSETGTNEPFFTHLVKGCLLFESLLKNNPTLEIKKPTLGPVLKECYKKLGMLKAPKISAGNFSIVMDYIESEDYSIEFAITSTGKIRNTLTHNLGWPDQLTIEQYQKGFELIALSCLHVISILY